MDYFSLDAGLGVSATFYYKNASGLAANFWAQVGLLPLVGKDVMSIRYARNINELNQVTSSAARTIPMEADALKSWYPGDAVSYTSRGGLLFYVGTGVPLPAVGATALAMGTFQTYVEKMDNQFVYVKITEGDVQSLGLQTGVGLVNVGVSRFQKLANSLSFVINTRDREGSMAYSDLVRGNVAGVQKLAMRSNAVRKWEKINSKQVGTLFSSFFGLPIILNTKSSSGSIQEHSVSRFYYANNRVESDYGIYLNEIKSTAFDSVTNAMEAFYGAAFRLIDGNGKQSDKGTFGQYVWSYNSNTSTPHELEMAMKEIVRKTGLRSQLLLNTPKVDNLRYSGLSFKLQFSESNTSSLLKRTARFGREQFVAQALKGVNEYFSKGGDRDDLCSQYMSQKGPYESRSLDEICKAEFIRETTAVASDMYDALSDMRYNRSRGYDKAFAQSYAKFGKAMMRNQFAFKLAVSAAGSGVAADYIVEGTNISQYVLTLDSTESLKQQFVRSYRDPLAIEMTGRGVPTVKTNELIKQ